MWKLFLDDERFPVNLDEFIIARTTAEAEQLVLENGLPSFISFDHDLGENQPTGFDFAKWLTLYCLNNKIRPDFIFDVHSQNPVGAENIRGLLDQFKEFYINVP